MMPQRKSNKRDKRKINVLWQDDAQHQNSCNKFANRYLSKCRRKAGKKEIERNNNAN